MADFTEVSSQGWFSRIMESIKGVLVGFVLFLVAFPLLAWNEYRALKTAKSLEEGGKKLVQLDSPEVKSDNEGQFVSFNGLATTDETLKDDVFPVSSEKTIHLVRKVEMYQWKENVTEKEETKLGGKKEKVKEYNYVKEWSDKHIDSAGFNSGGKAKKQEDTGETLENPPFPFDNKTFTAKKVTVGSFVLPDELVKKIHKDEPLPVAEPAKKAESGDDAPKVPEKFVYKDGGFYKGASPGAPVIGDVRVSFSVTKPTDVSVYGKQMDNTVTGYKTDVGDTLFELRMGKMSGSDMIKAAEGENVMFTWILRVVGFLMMAFGLYMMFSPLVVIADVVPMFGSLLSAGAAIFAIMIALPLTFLTIGIAWVAVRPMVGIPLVVGAIALIVGGIFLFRRKKKPAGPGAADARPSA